MRDITDDIMDDLNIQMFGNGVSGRFSDVPRQRQFVTSVERKKGADCYMWLAWQK
jgi:hypothetical protein